MNRPFCSYTDVNISCLHLVTLIIICYSIYCTRIWHTCSNNSGVLVCVLVCSGAIRYHLYNLKNLKNIHGGALLKVTLLHECLSRFLDFTNGTKLRKV